MFKYFLNIPVSSVPSASASVVSSSQSKEKAVHNNHPRGTHLKSFYIHFYLLIFLTKIYIMCKKIKFILTMKI